VFEGAQALPLFLVYYKKPSGKTDAGSSTAGGTAAGVSSGGDVEVVRKEMFSGGTTSPSSSSGEFSLLIFSLLTLDLMFNYVAFFFIRRLE